MYSCLPRSLWDERGRGLGVGTKRFEILKALPFRLQPIGTKLLGFSLVIIMVPRRPGWELL